MLGLALMLFPMTSARAAELQVLAGGGMAEPLKELATQFEDASGYKLVFRFGATPELIEMAKSDAPFDLGIVPVDVMKDSAARVRFASEPTTNIARAVLGVAVRSGASKPDISTSTALKQALLKAQSISTLPASATGTQVMRVFEALGIREEMQAKIKAQPSPAQVVQVVVNGEAELAVFLLNVLTAPGLDVVGPLPVEVQKEVVFTAAIAANTKEIDAAKAFINYLRTPTSAALIKARGMIPD
jgi:molybdate transport system substrate-binding protein